MARRNEYSIGS